MSVNYSHRLSVLESLESGCDTRRALALFDDLPPVHATEIRGRWRGNELPTGHRFDGANTAAGWYGKQFDSVDSVHPLLFVSSTGTVFAVDPRKLPMRLTGYVPRRVVTLVRPLMRLLRTNQPRARLRDIEHRGTFTAAMVYDHLPIIDVFRRVDEDTLLGVMDMRGVPDPYFFVLRRETNSSGPRPVR